MCALLEYKNIYLKEEEEVKSIFLRNIHCIHLLVYIDRFKADFYCWQSYIWETLNISSLDYTIGAPGPAKLEPDGTDSPHFRKCLWNSEEQHKG